MINPSGAGDMVRRLRNAMYPPGYQPRQVTARPEGIEVTAVEYWFMMAADGRAAQLPRGVALRPEPGETLERFAVRCALMSEKLLSPDD